MNDASQARYFATDHADLKEMLSHARSLYRIGLAPIPLCRPLSAIRCSARRHTCEGGGKRPRLSGYPALSKKRLPLHETLKWIRQFWPCNLGVVTNGPYVALEADTPESDLELAEILGSLATTAPRRAARPSRGSAWILRLPEGMTFKSAAKRGVFGAIDVPHLLVVPPSVHKSGHRYAWGLRPEAEIPLVSPQLRSLMEAWARPIGIGFTEEPRLVRNQLPPSVARLVEARKSLRDLYHGVGKRGGDESRSGYDWSLARALLMEGIEPLDAMAAISTRPGAHRRDPGYLRSTINSARAAQCRRRG